MAASRKSLRRTPVGKKIEKSQKNYHPNFLYICLERKKLTKPDMQNYGNFQENDCQRLIRFNLFSDY